MAGTKSYNEKVHALVDQGKNITPKIEHTLQAEKPTKTVLLLGSGFVAMPAAEIVLREPSNQLTVACRTLATAEKFVADLPNATAVSLDVSNTTALEEIVAAHDLVISLIPYTHHADVIKAAIKGKTHVVTTSYVSPAMRELDEEAKKAHLKGCVLILVEKENHLISERLT